MPDGNGRVTLRAIVISQSGGFVFHNEDEG
jgi:hypothetical protein